MTCAGATANSRISRVEWRPRPVRLAAAICVVAQRGRFGRPRYQSSMMFGPPIMPNNQQQPNNNQTHTHGMHILDHNGFFGIGVWGPSPSIASSCARQDTAGVYWMNPSTEKSRKIGERQGGPGWGWMLLRPQATTNPRSILQITLHPLHWKIMEVRMRMDERYCLAKVGDQLFGKW